jgi:hypothetical protein
MKRISGGAEGLIAACCFALLVALMVVGVVAKEMVRHLIQSAPFWVGGWLALRRSRFTKWVVLGPFLLWVLIPVLIWLFLFGVARILTGTYSPIEIAMTVVMALAGVVGIGAALASRSGASWWSSILAVVLGAAMAWGVLMLSFQPQVAHDSAVVAAVIGKTQGR